MNYYLIIVKLILFPYIFLGQNIISNDLHEKIIATSEDEFIPIIISINDNFDIKDLKKEFINNNTPIKKRSSIICDQMQKIAKKTQQPIINIIKVHEEKYKNLKASWIINTIFLEANKQLVELISNHPNIQSINLKKTKSDIIDYIETEEHLSINTENGTEPGIEAINVRPLWEMGYTGKGLLVFNYDTGVWPEHPAFADNFFGNHYPMEQCWDGYFADLPNGHVSDHGTHTLGTMTGLISETNDTIGIAFNSYWIANDFVTSSVETLPPIEDMITSFEWALNPDNDTSTDHDVPDVINNSWRWYNEIDTFQCSGYAVELMEVIEAAGIANIFSAGNNGPDNEGVRSPQRINTNLVNTFCVGSINGNDEEYPISTFSCRGPTQCPGSGSLSIYPEVVAPGQNVRSAWGTNEFNTISGTSMASPHVSGAVLLIKEAFPFLTGQEILLAIYNTAVDLGDEGEDNTFGMGIIDVYAAFNYLTESYDPTPPEFIMNDLVLLDITNTPNKISCEESFNPILHVWNNTDSLITELQIYYRDFLNEMTEDSILVEIELNINAIVEIELPTITNTEYGDKEFSFRVEALTPFMENDYHNNRRMLRYKYKPTVSLPFLENFQTGILNENWHINNNDYYRTWDTISTGGLNNDNIASYVNLFGYNPRSEQKDELISPNIYLTGDSIKLSFQTAYQKYNNSSKQDTLQVFLSNDCGRNYNYKIFEKGGEDLSSHDEITPEFIPDENDQWTENIIDLSDFIDDNIMLKFVTTNLRGNNIFIDNINIYNNENTNLLDEQQSDITVYPNPSSGIFDILFNYEYVKNISVHNSVNQLILYESFFEPNTNNYQLDLSMEKAGIYFITIQTKDKNRTKKIVKND